MSDPSLPGTPGTGPEPEPEPEGFREEQTEAERQRQLEEREHQAELNKEAAEKYSGKDLPDAGPTQGRSPAASGDYGSGDTPSKAKGTSHTTTRSSTTKRELMGNPAPKPSDARRRKRDVSASQAAHRLPITGRQGTPPKCPVRLGAAGRRWWRWAWATPQATLWHPGFIEPLAKRAQLEDQWVEALEGDADGDQKATDTAVRILPLILRMDDAFGLTPTSAAKLHYAFVADEPAPEIPTSAGVTDIRNRLKGMRD